MEKVAACAIPNTALAGTRWRGSEAKVNIIGPKTKQPTPRNMIPLLPTLSDNTPRGIDNKVVEIPETEASKPITETEAPRPSAKKGKVGMVELLEASVKNIATQRTNTPHIPRPFNSSNR
jgi:hypothetical protein